MGTSVSRRAIRRLAWSLIAWVAVVGPARAQWIRIVSIDSAGESGNGPSLNPAISADGRFVAFDSYASNLVAGDANGYRDVFVHDLVTGSTSLVSVSSDGVQANFDSFAPALSADGRFVAFHSQASNLAPNDANGKYDAFVHDRATGSTTLVSVDSNGAPANEDCSVTSLSADGRYVVIASHASNLVPGDVNGVGDIFVHDRQTGSTTLVSVDPSGGPANLGSEIATISADGRFVAFVSAATNLVPGDANGWNDVFVRDRETGTTVRVNVDSAGGEADSFSSGASISADGSRVAFKSIARLVPGVGAWGAVYVHDRLTGQIRVASVDSSGAIGVGGSSEFARISPDGRVVSFMSDSNLVPPDTNGFYDTFVHDLTTGETTIVSTDEFGAQANGGSWGGPLSADGRYIAFRSAATNLVPGNPGNGSQIYVRDRLDCRAGNVNARVGPVTDVVFVNDSAGGVDRIVRLTTYQPFSIFVSAPPAAQRRSRFALYAWSIAPGSGWNPSELPFTIGFTCLPTPLTGGSPAPRVVWNNSGSPLAGAPTRPSSPAPSIVLFRPNGLERPASFFLQGFIRDDGSPSGVAGVTNGVTVEIR